MPAAIKITAFTGEQPRIIARLLPPTGAQSAINARLDDGSLTPYRDSTFVANVPGSNPIGSNLRSVGVNIGDAVSGGGLAAAFDNNTSQALAASANKASATSVYVGKDFSTFPRRIARAVVYGSNDQGYVSGANPNITITLYGKNGAAPASATDGTVLGSIGPFADTANESGNPRTIDVSNTYLDTYWDYVWATIAQSGAAATMAVAEVQIFEGIRPPGTIYLHGEEWLAFPGKVDAAPGPVAADRLYYTGDGKPKIRIDASNTFLLKVPAPAAAPTASVSGSGTGDVSTRIYCYTFVTAYGEESEPSPASNAVSWQSGQTVTLSGIQGDPGGRNIVSQRFYRSQTGQVGTDFYFIAERSVSNADFVDTVAPTAIGEVLPSRFWNPPPDDLTGLIALPNGIMAAFVGKQLYFSEPYRPHAWPEIYILTVDYPIVALGALGTTLIVLTEGYPYRVTGTTPSAMVMEKIEQMLPCVNASGVVDLGHSIAWPSTDGLAVYRGDGSFGLASANLFSPREWQRLNPGTMKAGRINGRWIGSYDAVNEQGQPISGSLIIDLSGASFLIRSDTKARAWFHDIASGFLYFLDPVVNEVRQFDSPTGDTKQYYWKSKQFVLPKPDNMGCILIDTGGSLTPEQIAARQALIAQIQAQNQALFANPIGGDLAGEAIDATTLAGDLLIPAPPLLGTGLTVGVYGDGALIATVGITDRQVRLPSGKLARNWEIDAFGDLRIDQITLARTSDDLKQAAGGPA